MDFYLGRFAPIFLHLGKKSKLLIQTLISEDRNESATSSIILEILKHIILVWRSFLQNDLCKIHPSSFRTICCSFSNVEQERLSLSEALRAAYEILERFIDVGHFFDDKCVSSLFEAKESYETLIVSLLANRYS